MNVYPIENVQNIFRRILKKCYLLAWQMAFFFLIGEKERAFKELYVLVLSTEKQDLTLTADGDPSVSECNP